MSEDATPDLRASDGDRQLVAQALSQAFSRGQLSYSELDDRTAKVWAATFRKELFVPLADLMSDPASVLVEASPDPTALTPMRHTGAEIAKPHFTGGSVGQRFSFAMVGASQKRGHWLIARQHVSVSLVGATTLDLRRVRFTAPETTIWAFGVVGAVEVLVPEDVLVHSDGIGIVGAFEVTKDKEVTVEQRDLPADAPVIRVRGLGLVGAVSVRRVPRAATD